MKVEVSVHDRFLRFREEWKDSPLERCDTEGRHVVIEDPVALLNRDLRPVVSIITKNDGSALIWVDKCNTSN